MWYCVILKLARAFGKQVELKSQVGNNTKQYTTHSAAKDVTILQHQILSSWLQIKCKPLNSLVKDLSYHTCIGATIIVDTRYLAKKQVYALPVAKRNGLFHPRRPRGLSAFSWKAPRSLPPEWYRSRRGPFYMVLLGTTCNGVNCWLLVFSLCL